MAGSILPASYDKGIGSIFEIFAQHMDNMQQHMPIQQHMIVEIISIL